MLTEARNKEKGKKKSLESMKDRKENEQREIHKSKNKLLDEAKLDKII